VRSLLNLQHILHAGYERGVGIRWDDPLLLQMRPEKVFLASARSCCRWLGQRSSVPRPALPAVATSTACNPSAVRNRPRQSASPRRHRHRCAVWPRLANACGQARHRRPSSTSCRRVRATVSTLVSKADASETGEGWRDCEKSPPPSTEACLGQLPGRMFTRPYQRVEPFPLLIAEFHYIPSSRQSVSRSRSISVVAE